MKTLHLFFLCLLVPVAFLTWHNLTSLESFGINFEKLEDAPDFRGTRDSVSIASGADISGSSRQSKGRGALRHNITPNVKFGSWTSKKAFKFFLLAPSEFTSDFLYNYPDRASRYYRNHINEESAEVWLHRGFAHMTDDQGKTDHPNEADAILIAGYFHLNAAFVKRQGGKGTSSVDHSLLLATYEKSLASIHGNGSSAKTKPHLLLIPTWNPSVAATIGVKALTNRMKDRGFSNLWSVGFERNSMWQGVPIERILPIPYVLRPDESSSSAHIIRRKNCEPPTEEDSSSVSSRVTNLVFYAGDARRNAKQWAGCHRDKLIPPIQNGTLVDVRLVTKHNRLNQSEYNYRMRTSDFCLILCGDTPSSRSLTAAMVSGCIPVRVGSRLRGLCESPCHRGFGWQLAGYKNPHLPYAERIPWDVFPEVNEQSFMDDGAGVLSELFQGIDNDYKKKIRSIMHSVKKGWIYGRGDPVNSTCFGEVTEYVWNSFVSTLTS